MALDQIFKAYDVRGTYPDQFDEDLAYRIGGAFATVGGQPQPYLAAVDAVTGAWRPGFPSAAGGPVTALARIGPSAAASGQRTSKGCSVC